MEKAWVDGGGQALHSLGRNSRRRGRWCVSYGDGATCWGAHLVVRTFPFFSIKQVCADDGGALKDPSISYIYQVRTYELIDSVLVDRVRPFSSH